MIYTVDNNNGHWTPMDNNGQQWITMDNNEQQWTTMDKNEQQWTAMENNGNCVATVGFRRVKNIKVKSVKYSCVVFSS